MINQLSWVVRLFKRSSAQAAEQSEKNARFIVEEMEPRKLFSADPLGGLLEPNNFELPQVETLVVDHVSESYNHNSSNAIPDDLSSTDIEIRHEVVFIDSGVENYEQLIDDLNSQSNGSRIFSVFILDSGKNGIEQITDELQNYEDVDAIHILSHGTQGSVSLGNIQFNSNKLSQYDRQISLWKNAFDQGADILIYGCELVGNEAGEELTTQLSELTGTDVAASVNDTGSAEKGGDWELEFSTGVIETQIAISEQTQQSWNGLLAFETYRDEFETASFTNSDGSQYWGANPWQEINESDGAGTGQVYVSNGINVIYGTGDKGVYREVDLSGATHASLSFDYAAVGLDDASPEVFLEVSDNGGAIGSWSELEHWTGPLDDVTLTFASYDISAYIASNTQIRFKTVGFQNGDDTFFFDNFQVSYASDLSSTSEFLVNQNTTGVQETSAENRGSHQSVAVASNGDYVVVWTEVEGTGDLSDVFAQQYYADGTIKTEAFQVNSTSADEQQWATVASDASGRFVIAWTSQNQDGNGQGVYLKRFNANGSAIDTDDVLVNSSNIAGNQHSASVTLNSQGNMVISWQSDETGNEGVYAKLFDMTVATIGNEVPTSLITVASGTNQQNPSVDINSEGKFVIAWKLNTDIYAQLFDEYSNKHGTQFKINALSSQFPVVAIQDSGNVLVAYRAEFIAGIWVRQFDDDGVEIGAPTKVSSNFSHTAPSIAKGLEGNFIVVYEGTGDGGGQGVFAQKYDFNKNAIGSQFQINETITGNQQMASVAMLDLDHYVAVWSGEGAGDNNGVFARQFNTSSPNSPPTLTIFSSPIDSGYEEVEQEITFAELEEKGNQIDSDGTVESFVVKAVNSGTLRIGTDALTATAWTAGTNDTIGSTKHAYWMPAPDANGTLNAFEVVAKDNLNAESSTNVTVTITVVQNAPPIADASASSPYSIYEGDSLTLDATDSSDPDSDTLTYLWDLDNNGTYGDASGVNPIVDWLTLKSYGINDDGTYTIGLKVDDGKGGVNTTVTTLIVHNTVPILSTTGLSSVDLNSAYSLNLSVVDPGADTISAWTINWGDGTIESIAGNPTTVTHTYTNGGYTYNILASATDEDGAYLQNDLLTPSYYLDHLFRFDSTAGVINEFAIQNGPSDPGPDEPGIDRTSIILIGPDGYLYVSSEGSDEILRYDAETDTYIDTFITAATESNLDSIEGVAFGPDGKLYVADWDGNKVVRFNADGSFFDIFVTAGSGGLNHPYGMVFGSDNNLYVSNYNGNKIFRYDGNTGAFLGKGVSNSDPFVTSGAGDATLGSIEEMVFGPDGNLYLANLNKGNVLRYDGSTGEFIDIFVTAGSNGLVKPSGLAFGPDGHLYVSDFDTGVIQRYNGGDGSLMLAYVDASNNGNLETPVFLEFVPEQQVTVSLVVTPNQTPVISNQNFSLLENSSDSSVVGSVSASDPNAGDSLSYSITAGNSSNAFVINSSTGEIAVADSSQLDYETTPTFGLTIQVMDDGTGNLSSTATISIHLNPVNEAPVINDRTFELLENSINGSVVGNVIASDQDVGDNLSYSITAGNSSNAFAISATGEITVADSSQLDYETTPTFSLTVQVMDDGTGNLSSTATISINLNPVNEVPVINDQTFALLENSSVGSVVGSVSASDPDAGDSLSYSITTGNSSNAFAINSSTGVITVVNSSQLDYETTPTFSLTVQVMDDGTGNLSNTATISINLNPVNEAPIINDQTFALAENSSDGSVVGSVIASDPDTGDSLNYSITAGNSSGAFTINSSTGEITVADSSQLDYETTPTFSLTIQVMDDGTGNLSNTATISIHLNPVNEAPVINDQTFALLENSINGSVVGNVNATDPDAGDSLNYSITEGNSSGAFTINSSTGEITVADSSQLDYETTPTFSLTIQVMDDGTGNLSSTATISIHLNPVNEVPIINDQTFALLENSINGSVVGNVIVSDPGVGDNLSYSITAGNSSNTFALNSTTGEITVADSSQLDYETTPTFSLTVQVMDDGIDNLSNTATINIALIEINELPDSISLSNNTIDEHVNTSAGYSIGRLVFSDENSDNFQIVGGVDQERFSIGGGDNNELILTDGILDFENQSSYQVTVRAIESEGGSHNETFIIIVNNLNEKPQITSENSITLEENITKVTTVIAEDENQPIQKLSYFISGGADSELFLLDNNTGELSFKTAPDFESPGDSNAENTYLVEITVDDGNGGTFTQSISIQIENAAEAPNLSDQSVTLDEKSDSGTLVTILVANDPDVDDTFSYSILGGELSNAFTIDSSGQLIVSHPELLINQDNPIVSVVIQVTDSQGLTDTSVVQIDVRSILLNSSDETEVEIKPEAEIEKQEEFSFSVLTELPFEEGENITKNDIAIKPELNESVSEEQTKAEVNENTVNIILDTKQGSEINDSFGGDVKTKQEKSSFSTQKYNFNKQENNWTSKNILIKAKVVVGNTQIIPQFSYFEIATKELQYLIEESGFSESLDVLREQIQENTYFEKTVVGSSITLTTGLSIGYVIWLVRGGVLLSSVLSSLPAWRMIDPLPVISSLNGSLDNDDKNSDSLASLIKKGSEVVKAKVKVQTPTSPVD